MSTARLTRLERRMIWVASAIFLATILFLFTVGIFYKNVEFDNPMLDGFYWISNVVAATASAILASTITGFAKIELERKIGSNGRYFVQGTGGFVVFLMVMWSNPKNAMFNFADRIFAGLVADCKAAAGEDGSIHPNGGELCKIFTERYPSRPEPWRYLARWTHLNKGSEGFESASNYYKVSAENYGISFAPEDPFLKKKFAKLNDMDIAHAIEVVSGYIVTRADFAVNKWGVQDIDTEAELMDIIRIIDRTRAELLNPSTDPFVWGRIFDVKGKILLYVFYLKQNEDQSLLDRSIDAFNIGIEKHPYFSMLLVYHRFIAQLSSSPNRSNFYMKAKSEFANLLDIEWDKYFNYKMNTLEQSSFRTFITSMIENKRAEMYRVSRPFGSKVYAGPLFKHFLDQEEAIKTDLLDRVSRL